MNTQDLISVVNNLTPAQFTWFGIWITEGLGPRGQVPKSFGGWRVGWLGAGDRTADYAMAVADDVAQDALRWRVVETAVYAAKGVRFPPGWQEELLQAAHQQGVDPARLVDTAVRAGAWAREHGEVVIRLHHGLQPGPYPSQTHVCLGDLQPGTARVIALLAAAGEPLTINEVHLPMIPRYCQDGDRWLVRRREPEPHLVGVASPGWERPQGVHRWPLLEGEATRQAVAEYINNQAAAIDAAGDLVGRWIGTTDAADLLGSFYLTGRPWRYQRLQQMADDDAYGLDVRNVAGRRLIGTASLVRLVLAGIPDRRGRPSKITAQQHVVISVIAEEIALHGHVRTRDEWIKILTVDGISFDVVHDHQGRHRTSVEDWTCSEQVAGRLYDEAVRQAKEK